MTYFVNFRGKYVYVIKPVKLDQLVIGRPTVAVRKATDAFATQCLFTKTSFDVVPNVQQTLLQFIDTVNMHATGRDVVR